MINDASALPTRRRRTLLEKVWQRTPPRVRYSVTIVCAALISVGDVLWAARYSKPPSATRGGGFAALLALFIGLILPDFGRRNYQDNIKEIPLDASEIERLKGSLGALTHWVEIDNADRTKQTKAIFVATAIGTFFWNIGDIFAYYLVQWFPHFFPKY